VVPPTRPSWLKRGKASLHSCTISFLKEKLLKGVTSLLNWVGCFIALCNKKDLFSRGCAIFKHLVFLTLGVSNTQCFKHSILELAKLLTFCTAWDTFLVKSLKSAEMLRISAIKWVGG